MSIKVNIEINVAAEGYTEHEVSILQALAAHPSQGAAAVIPAAEKPAVRVLADEVDLTARTKEAADARIAESRAKAKAEAEAKAAAAAKAKADLEAKKAAAAAEAEAAVEAAAAPEEASEDLVGGGTAHTLADAVAEATKRVSSGKAAEVKAALAGTGAKKVSELTPEGVAAFMTALGL